MAYNSSLANACKHLEFTPAATDVVTDTEATAMWSAIYLEIFGGLGAMGITIGSSSDLTYVQEIEALGTSARVGAAFETQAGGRVSEKTRHLEERYHAAMKAMVTALGARMLETLGATVSGRLRCSSMATDFPNGDLDTSGYENPLQDQWKIGGDL